MLSRKVLPFLVLMTLVIGYAFGSTWHDPWGPMRWTGAVLLVVGFLLSGLARVQLGESFSVAPEAHELVTRGLYSRIRSPIYVFGLVGIAGLFLVLGQPIGLLLVVFLIPVQWIRTRKEAKVLEEKFGEAYRDYRRHTWF
ncbi:MAG TPA: isoprenylcysteine carboxylmethyltransferase family protein [Candidatus Acidoferrales bacterium]|jgi:protein-S-isoprenylcysteine O-methyltransferase Ste14|nr:isoprenylcysteine carboxylmethyltransferase family protein [Candidatus Acidoferrales bacterium]